MQSIFEMKPPRSYLGAVLSCRCPRCRDGKMFKNPVSVSFKKNMEMNKKCAVCRQVTEIEVGFYYGTSYVSYGISVLISLLTLAIWALTIGLSTEDNRFFWWMGLNAAFLIFMQPYLMRLSRAFWFSWFIKFDPMWKSNKPVDFNERRNDEQANNW